MEPINSFPISHWTDLETERGRAHQESAPAPAAVASKKRFSLQSEVINDAGLVSTTIHPVLQTDGPGQTFHHRYSLPLLEPSKGSNLVSINLDNYWDSSKFLLESRDPGDDYLAGSSVAGSHDLSSDADLDTRLEVLCLSVTQNALD